MPAPSYVVEPARAFVQGFIPVNASPEERLLAMKCFIAGAAHLFKQITQPSAEDPVNMIEHIDTELKNWLVDAKKGKFGRMW